MPLDSPLRGTLLGLLAAGVLFGVHPGLLVRLIEHAAAALPL